MAKSMAAKSMAAQSVEAGVGKAAGDGRNEGAPRNKDSPRALKKQGRAGVPEAQHREGRGLEPVIRDRSPVSCLGTEQHSSQELPYYPL